MSLRIRARLGVTLVILAGVAILALVLSAGHGAQPQSAEAAEPEAGKEARKKADNRLCYVCHLTLKKEAITTVHLAEGHGCTECHGPSTDHMQDEMLMTTPDRLYGRREVDAMCVKCHEDSHEHVEAEVKAFLKKWRGRERENGRVVKVDSICTDCHGTHNINKETDTRFGKKLPVWIPLFNGRDLSGWKPAGEAAWKIKRGRIVATPGPTGGGNLLTTAEYEDYRLAVTFRADLPIHAGVWLRATDADPGPRVEIFKRRNPTAFTGSVALAGKGLLLINLDEDLFDAGGWNTLSVEVRRPRVAVWLNGEEVGAVRIAGPGKGRIGLYLEGGADYKNAQLTVREVLIQKLAKEKGEKKRGKAEGGRRKGELQIVN